MRRIALAATALAAIGGTWLLTSYYKLPMPLRQPPKHCLTIFIHGTFNPGLGLLSVVNLFSDNIENSQYARIVGSMRDDDFFYQEQPMLGRGLQAFTPSFAVPTSGYKLASYPIAAAYEAVEQALHPGKTNNHFYAFGWSGLLSAQERLAAAAELAQGLRHEYQSFTTRGITPHIRIVAHSHGGNVALGLGAHHTHLPHIDELVLLGTPIQGETSDFARSPCFGRVYNLYSSADVAQSADFISTKQRGSKQQLDYPKHKNITQAQLRINYDPEAPTTKKKQSVWAKLFGNGASTSCDPSHKDLWFLTWNSEFCQPNFPFKPLPMVIFVPLMLDVLCKSGDVQLNIATNAASISACVLGEPVATSLPFSLFEEIRQQVLAWEPERLSRQVAFADLLARR